MLNPVACYFEIPVHDLERAIKFYRTVFDCVLELVHIDGNQMANFPFVEKGLGISGALAKGENYVPGKKGGRIYFSTINIDQKLNNILVMDDKALYPKTCIGDLGWVAEFEDSEGNCIALSQLV